MMQLHLNPTQFKASNTDPTTAVLNLPLYTHTYQGNLLHYTFNLALYTHTWNGNLLYYTFNLALSTHTSAGNLLHYTFNLPLYTHIWEGNLLHYTLNTATVHTYLRGEPTALHTQHSHCTHILERGIYCTTHSICHCTHILQRGIYCTAHSTQPL